MQLILFALIVEKVRRGVLGREINSEQSFRFILQGVRRGGRMEGQGRKEARDEEERDCTF